MYLLWIPRSFWTGRAIVDTNCGYLGHCGPGGLLLILIVDTSVIVDREGYY